MLTTEEEAKTKRCQESFGPVPDADPRRFRPNEPAIMSPVNCLASACMAWRWGGAMGNHEDGTGKMFGYCGKAGRP